MAWNFAAGPARLPDVVLERSAEVLFRRGIDGASSVERPFTGPDFRRAMAETSQRLAGLLDLPPNYQVLFMAGGAMQQFALLPLNLAAAGQRVAYADSGYWSHRAMAEAGASVVALEVARYPGAAPRSAPPLGRWAVPSDCAYCHITPNETVDGIAYPGLPDCAEVPLVADCTSAFLTAPLAIENFGMVYASAQKNIGISGLTVAVICQDLLERSPPELPAVFSYRQQAASGSCVNTPPMAAILIAGMVFDWIADQGGLSAMAAASQVKAACLYATIDGSAGFYQAPVLPGSRSLVNVRFHLADPELTETFITEAEAAGLYHLRGHPRIGGLRASLYNAMPVAGVIALVDFMVDFARRRG